MSKRFSDLCPSVFIGGNFSSAFRGMWMVLVGVALVGCASPGTLVARQDRNDVPKMGVAPMDGTYGLFIAGQQQDLYEVSLKKGQPLGFEAGDDGPFHWVYGVAGKLRRPLDWTQVYDWRLLQ